MKSIILTGGGTAGHIMPNIALLPELEKEFDKIYYLGASDSMEQKIISEYKNIEFIEIPTTKLIRKLTIKNLAIPFKLINSIRKTKKIIKSINPNVIFCKGGFVSVPVAIAGKMCKVPVISHESDLSMGLANKIILRFAKKVCTTFSDTARVNKKCIVTGTPLRKQIFEGNKEKIKSRFLPDNKKPFILFFGGSLGSKFINTLVENSLDKLTKKYNVLHITGRGNKNKNIAKNYYQLEFTNTIQDYFACADIIICRGGANSLFEVLALKKPMLIIPLSKAESRGDQLENAEYFKKHYNIEVMQESESSTFTLLHKLDKIYSNKQKIISSMNTAPNNANKKIIEIIKTYQK